MTDLKIDFVLGEVSVLRRFRCLSIGHNDIVIEVKTNTELLSF